jgi:hypothetical protein
MTTKGDSVMENYDWEDMYLDAHEAMTTGYCRDDVIKRLKFIAENAPDDDNGTNLAAAGLLEEIDNGEWD